MALNVNDCKEILKIKETLSGVSAEDADKIISKAFRKEIKKYHPDSNPDLDKVYANKKSSEINAAYEYLNKIYVKKIDPEQSQYEYDDISKNNNAGSQSQKQNYNYNEKQKQDSYQESKQKSSNSNSSNESKSKSNDSNNSKSNESKSKSNDSNNGKSNYDYEYKNKSKTEYEYSKSKYSKKTKFSDDNIFKRAGDAVKDFFENVKDYFADLADDIVYGLKENAIKIVVAGLIIGAGYFGIKHVIDNNNKEDEFVFDGGYFVNMQYAKWHFDLTQMGRDFYGFKTSNLNNDISKQEFENLFENYKNMINQNFATKNVNLVFCENESVLADKKSEFNQILSNGQAYTERQIFVLEKETYTPQEAETLYETLVFTTIEEYFRENIGMVKVGSLLDNIMLNDLDSSEENYATLLADIYMYSFLSAQNDWRDNKSNLYEEHFRNIILDVYEPVTSDSYENYILSIDNLLKIYFEDLSEKYDVELTEDEIKSSALYSGLYQLNHYYSHGTNALLKSGGYPRYADLFTGKIVESDSMFFSSRLTSSTNINTQIEDARKTLGKELTDENYGYLEENVAPMIADLLAISRVGYYTTYHEAYIYNFIVDYKNFMTEEQKDYYGLRDPLQVFYNVFGYDNYEEFYERAKEYMSSAESQNKQKVKQTDNHKQTSNQTDDNDQTF